MGQVGKEAFTATAFLFHGFTERQGDKNKKKGGLK